MNYHLPLKGWQTTTSTTTTTSHSLPAGHLDGARCVVLDRGTFAFSWLTGKGPAGSVGHTKVSLKVCMLSLSRSSLFVCPARIRWVEPRSPLGAPALHISTTDYLGSLLHSLMIFMQPGFLVRANLVLVGIHYKLGVQRVQTQSFLYPRADSLRAAHPATGTERSHSFPIPNIHHSQWGSHQLYRKDVMRFGSFQPIVSFTR